MIQLQDGGVSFLDEIDENQEFGGIGLTGDGGKRYGNESYCTNEKLLDELVNQEFDIFEVVMKKFNMHSTSDQGHGCFS